MALQDKIGREEFVNKICGLVDSLQKDKNFCLAINGAWGSGKTFVLDMITEKLSQKQECIIIKYDAWENSFYPDPLIAILFCILDSLKINSEVKNLQRKKALKKYIKKNFVQKFDESIDKIVDELYKVGGWAGVAAYAVEKIKSIIKETKNSILDNKLFDDFKSYQNLIQEFYSVVNKLTGYEKEVGKQTKLVILVDEIDRCLPDEQLKILERLHHLFKVNNCAVIVTMNQGCVAKTVETIYGVDGYEYLRKFFNFTFRLNTSANEYLNNLLTEYTKSFEKLQPPTNEVEYPVKLAYQCLLYGSKKALDKADNRELTCYFECVANVCNDFGWQRLNQQYVFFILLALYIRKIISPTFLNADEIVAKQNSISETYKNLSLDEKQYVMPYYDYLEEFLGVDRSNPPEEFSQKSYVYINHIPLFSWAFNQIVYFSRKQEFPYNEMREFLGQNVVNPNDCKELCRLVILYGGEQEKCER